MDAGSPVSDTSAGAAALVIRAHRKGIPPTSGCDGSQVASAAPPFSLNEPAGARVLGMYVRPRIANGTNVARQRLRRNWISGGTHETQGQHARRPGGGAVHRPGLGGARCPGGRKRPGRPNPAAPRLSPPAPSRTGAGRRLSLPVPVSQSVPAAAPGLRARPPARLEWLLLSRAAERRVSPVQPLHRRRARLPARVEQGR